MVYPKISRAILVATLYCKKDYSGKDATHKWTEWLVQSDFGIQSLDLTSSKSLLMSMKEDMFLFATAIYILSSE